MLQDLRIEKEDLQALLSEMEKRGFVATTLHEIRTFTIAQRRTPRAPDKATASEMPNSVAVYHVVEVEDAGDPPCG